MSKIHCVGAYQVRASVPPLAETQGFNGHPPLGVNATDNKDGVMWQGYNRFQRAPTLGGECYENSLRKVRGRNSVSVGTHPWG